MANKFLLVVCITWAIGEPRKHPSLFSNRPLYIRVPSLNFCEEKPTDTELENYTISYDKTSVIINAIITLNRDVQQVKKHIVVIRQCKNPTEERNCEHFQTWRFGTEMCLMIDQKNMMWSGIFEAFHPRIKCHLHKGTYHLTNGTVDTETIRNVFKAIPIEKYFWRLRGTFFDNQMFICYEFSVSFIR